MSDHKDAQVSLMKFVGERLACGPTLVCPLGIMWNEYVDFCDEQDLPSVEPAYFAAWMASFPDVQVEDRGRGRRISGIGFRPKETQNASNVQD